MYQRDETPYEKKLKEEQFKRFKNVMNQFVSPQPEERSDEQIPAVSGPLSSHEDLLPCPFCGSKADFYENIGENTFDIVCTNKECVMLRYGFDLHWNKDKLINAWNSRT